MMIFRLIFNHLSFNPFKQIIDLFVLVYYAGALLMLIFFTWPTVIVIMYMDTLLHVNILMLCSIPLYIAVIVKYGSQVSRELTPLWVIGPLIVALYVKLLRGIFALYVFSFKQSVKIMKNLPTYYSIACNYLAEGKLKEDINARFWQPIKSVKNLNYKELVMERWKAVRDWLVERYLDFVESIWPHYCRTIRFLKRANLI